MLGGMALVCVCVWVWKLDLVVKENILRPGVGIRSRGSLNEGSCCGEIALSSHHLATHSQCHLNCTTTRTRHIVDVR